MKYKDYQEKNYPTLSLSTSRKSNGYWPNYRTRFGSNIYLYHKMSDGFVDLTLNKAADYVDVLEHIEAWARQHGITNVGTAITGASAALRIKVPELDMQRPFEEYEEKEIPECFEAIQELIDFANVAQSISKLNNVTK